MSLTRVSFDGAILLSDRARLRAYGGQPLLHGRVDNVLAIVEDQEKGFADQEFDETLGQCVAWHFPQPERGGDGVHHVRGVDQCGELDEPRAVGVLARDLPRNLHSQPCFAAPACTGQSE